MKPIIALDADGVLVDYHEGYADAWTRTFGERPALRDAAAYWPTDRWKVRHLEGEELATFRKGFDAKFWESLPAVAGAVQACDDLAGAGYELVCVTAMESDYESARLRNLRDHGFPISRVIATRSESTGISPKAAALRALEPVAFVDDYLPYMQGIPEDIHTALVLREPNGSPNCGVALERVSSRHADLADFARWWLTER